MQDPRWSFLTEGLGTRGGSPGEQPFHHLVMCIAVVDEHRLPDPAGKLELPCERVTLHVGGRQVAEEIEADLADGRGPRISGQCLKGRPTRFIDLGGMVRVHADGSRNEGRVRVV